MPERLNCVCYKNERYINTFIFTFFQGRKLDPKVGGPFPPPFPSSPLLSPPLPSPLLPFPVLPFPPILSPSPPLPNAAMGFGGAL